MQQKSSKNAWKFYRGYKGFGTPVHSELTESLKKSKY